MGKEEDRKPEEIIKDDIDDMIKSLGGKIEDEKKDDQDDEDQDDQDEEDDESDEEQDDDDSDDDEDNDDEDESDDDESEDDNEDDEDENEDESEGDDDEDEEDDQDEDNDDEDEEDDDKDLELKLAKAELDALKLAKGAKDVKIEPKGLKEVDYLKDIDLEELVNDKEAFNKLLNNIGANAYQAALRDIPSVAVKLAKEQGKVDTAIENFYKDNKDLNNVKEYVMLTAQKLQNQYPTLDTATLLITTAKTVRKNLGLKKKVEKIQKKTKKKRTDNKDKPGTRKKGSGGGGHGRKRKDTRTAQEKEFDDMNAAT